MNRLFTSTSRVLAALLFVALTTESAAQSFPLPYNPDENGDGLIGVVDLQGLLSNYGSEFSGTVISEDGENAITYMGDMAYPVCAQACRNLPGMWEMPDVEDLGLVWDEVYTIDTDVSTWLKQNPYNVSEYHRRFYSNNSGSHSLSAISNIGANLRCYCAARQLPRVEYCMCTGDLNDGNENDIKSCADEKVSEGWYPVGGLGAANGKDGQAFWRWAE